MDFNANTYCLTDMEKGDSNAFYIDLSDFTDMFIKKADKLLNDVLIEYMDYLCLNESRIKRRRKECILEFLVLGVLWETYLPMAINSNKIVEKSLLFLTYLRQRNVFFKKIADSIRGILSTFLLRQHMDKYKSTPVRQDNILKRLKILIKWLSCTGEFEQEVKRLGELYDFMSIQQAEKRYMFLEKIMELTEWFRINSEKYLGKYTLNVEQYIKNRGREHFWSEDVLFCNRKRVEYHLNMAAAEILNRDYREDYLKAAHKTVFLPVCMRIRHDGRCRAEKNAFGYNCRHCTSACPVSDITKAGYKLNFDVLVIPHSSMLFSKNYAKSTPGKDMAIIGVACPLQLIAGGWKAKAVNIPAQCVLLDYCGCKSHWDKKGITTGLNMNKLMEILNADIKK